MAKTVTVVGSRLKPERSACHGGAETHRVGVSRRDRVRNFGCVQVVIHAARHGEQVDDAHRLGGGDDCSVLLPHGQRTESGEVVRNLVGQLQPTFLNQPHCRSAGDDLGCRKNPPQGVVIHGALHLCVRIADRAAVDLAPVPRDRKVAPRKPTQGHFVQKPIQFICVHSLTSPLKNCFYYSTTAR